MSNSKREEFFKIDEEDTRKLVEFGRIADEIKQIQLDKIQKRYDDIKAKIKQLQDEKHELLRAPLTKKDLLEIVKAELHKQRKDYAIKEVLKPYLEGCQTRYGQPFSQLSLKLAFDPDKCWKLAYFCFSDEDIEEAVALLDDIGIARADQEAKVKEIDKEISRLEKLIEKELKDLKLAVA